MTANSTSLITLDEGTFWRTGQTDYGVLAISAGFVLTRWEINGEISFKAGTITSTDTILTSTHLIGLQYGPEGYTPYPLVTADDMDSHTWLMAQMIVPPSDSVVFAPDTDTATYIPRRGFSYSANLQHRVLDTSQWFNLTVSDATSGTPGEYRVFATLRLFYE